MSEQKDAVEVEGFRFVRDLVTRELNWWSPCISKLVAFKSPQAVVDVKFHLLTCDDCIIIAGLAK